MKPLQKIEAVTFDVGGTLIEPWPSVGHVYAQVASAYGWTDLDPEKLTRQFFEVWQSQTSFSYSRGAWAELVARTLQDRPGSERHMEFFDDLYERFSHPDVWRIYDDVLPTIEMLMERGIDLGIVSNWDERLRPLLGRLKLDSYFRVIVISQEIGFHKPSPVIFEEAIRKFTCVPSSVLHIGDSQREDVQGAGAAGLQTLWLDRRGGPAGEPGKIGTLLELARLLG